MEKKPQSIDVQSNILPDGSWSPEMKAFLENAMEKMKKNAVDHKQPPWAAFPQIPRHSIGWRMGSGEDYWHAFHEWMRKLGPAELDVFVAENPEIEGWEGFYEKFYD